MPRNVAVIRILGSHLNVLLAVAVSPGTASNTRITLLNMSPNQQNNSAHLRGRGAWQSDPQSGQGEGGQTSYMEVDGAFGVSHYPGSGPVNTPAFHPQRNQGGVTSPLSQFTEPYPQIPQQPNRTHAAITGTHRNPSQHHGSVSGSFGAFNPSSNPSFGQPPHTPASFAAPPRQEAIYGVAGHGNGPSPSSYFPADGTARPPTATGATGGHDPQSQRYGSAAASGSGLTSSSNRGNAHQSRPRCKLPRCEKAAIFDRSINEQREFCEDHIGHMVPVGFAGCCAMCQKMPARLDSEFCSDACRSMSTHMGLPGSHQQQQPTAPRQPAPHMQRAPSGGGSGVAVGVPHGNKRSAENSVPEGLGLTCQECRRAITKESRIGSRFCGRNCEEASRKYNNSSSSSKSRR